MCHAPFTSLHLDPRGDVRACCQNEWMRLGNVREAGLRELWNGPRAARLRAEVAAGSYRLGCEQCADQSRDAGPDAAYARNFDRLGPTPATPEWPVQLELGLSNACNLQCVMCNGELSSAIRIHREGRPPMPTVYTDAFFEELDDFLPHLRSVGFVGGEPFLAAETLRVMHRLVELDLRPHCTVTTNGTQWSPRVERLVEALPMHVGVSIDAVDPDLLRSIRVGVDSDELLHNVGRIHRSLDRHGGTMSILYCLMRVNVAEFTRVALLADRLGVPFIVNAVTHPPHLSLVHAGDDELTAAIRTLESDPGRARLGPATGEVWDRELEGLRGLLDRRRTGPRRRAIPVAVEPVEMPGATVVRADRGQIVRYVDNGALGARGVVLDDMVGGSIWGLAGRLTERLGELQSSTLERSADGIETRVVVLGEGPGRVRLRARFEPLPDGVEQWTLEAEPYPAT